MTTTERVPVLIVGSGLAGTSAAMFLGLHGVPALLIERHPSTSTQPKARGQSAHTMEALRIAGVADRVRDAGYDMDLGMPIVIAESVAGRQIHQLMGEKWPDWSHLTPVRGAMASQQHAERIMLERARELGVQARFSTRLSSLEQDADGVTARLTELDTGRTYQVCADYLIAADGWRSPIRTALEIGTHGRGDLGHSMSVQFDAELDDVVRGREFALFYLRDNPGLGSGAVFVSTDTPGRWVLLFGYDPDAERPEDFTEEQLIAKVRSGVGIEDLDVRLVDWVPTGMAHRVADTFTRGRVHLIGDAAHTMPPHGGQGGNTAVLDGFYLAWKLAAVVRGWAGPALLDSHDAERRPYGELIAGHQYANMIMRSVPHLADGTEDEILLAEHTLLGYRYPDGAIVPEPDEDGAIVADPERTAGRPGSRAPHVWLPDGSSTMDLFGRGFVVLTGSGAWARAARKIAERLGVPLRAEVLAGDEWCRAYGVGVDGASLVRPDRFVAWRSRGAGTVSDLEHALRTVLSR